MNLEELLESGKRSHEENKRLTGKLKKSKPKDLDTVTAELDEQAFNEIDCLSCANCCKTTSPAMHEKDVDRLSKHLKIRPAALIQMYMKKDEEGDYVFTSAPCPFLGADNYCSVYDARPLACRGYPHTNRKRFYQVLDLSLKNTAICPAVVQVFDGLREKYG